jgi:hypothetical protein
MKCCEVRMKIFIEFAMKTLIGTLVTIVVAGALSVGAAEAPVLTPLQAILTHAPSAELPAKAAELIKDSPSRERAAVTVEVVRAAVGINPAAAPAIVGAIARAVPDEASIAAATAAEMLPRQAADIAKAASAAAPSKAGKIVAAVCRAAPKEYHGIALESAQAAPAASTEILRAVASVFPDLKPGIERALTGYVGNPQAVAVVLETTKPSAPPPPVLLPGMGGGILAGGGNNGGAVSRGPSIAPPYVVPSGTATNLNPANSGNVTRGGRNYAAP